MWSSLTYSCQSKLDYWLRLMPPSETHNAAEAVDQALLAAAESLGVAARDPITQARLRLAARMRGGGMRARGLVRLIAFVACFIESVERMFGVASMPVLHRCFGHGAFAEGGPRLTAFLLADGPVAREFSVAWRALQQMVAGSGVTGPLDDAVAFAGASRGDSRHLQRAITAQLEQVFRDRLHSDIAAFRLAVRRRRARPLEEYGY